MAELAGKCAKCPFKTKERICNSLSGKNPEFCSTVLYPDVIEASIDEFKNSAELFEFARNASIQEAECYAPSPFDPNKTMPQKPRILEIIEFCQKQGYKKIGLAFCLGLTKEAAALVDILESHGLEVVSVVCKVGCTDKSVVGVKEEEKIHHGGHESMCNPVAQAMILNKEKTDFNLILGLCVGHDSMFLKYSEAMTTVVAVKDRLLGHNPLAALYSGYFGYLKK